MKTRFDKISYPLYCDAGPYAGDMRIDLTIRLYLTPDEYARYEGTECLQITLSDGGGVGREQRPLEPVYLRGVLTVEAELSAGRLYDGSTYQENASPVLAALVFTGGTAMLITEDQRGQITRLRIPGPGFLRLTDDAAGKLARSRPQPDRLGEPGGPSPICPGKEPGRS